MALFDDGNTAAAAGNHHLSGICQCADGVNLYDINGLGGRYHTAESFAGLLYHIISFLDLNLGILRRHIAADDFSRLVECFVVRVYGHLRQNRADGLGNAPTKQLCAQGVLYVISHIPLTHGGADAHRSRCVVDIDPAQLGHGFVDHADLGAVAVGDGKLVPGFHQVCQRPGSDFHGVMLLQSCVSECFVSQ